MWFRDEHLSKSALDIVVTNAATKTKAKVAGKEAIASIDAAGLTLTLPRNLCASGHFVSIRMTLKEVPGVEKSKDKTIFDLEATAKVVECTPADGKTQLVVLRFYQQDEQKWAKFNEHLSSRQKAATKALEERQD